MEDKMKRVLEACMVQEKKAVAKEKIKEIKGRCEVEIVPRTRVEQVARAEGTSNIFAEILRKQEDEGYDMEAGK